MAEQAQELLAVSIDRAAYMLDASSWTVRGWIKSGKLPASKVGKSWRVNVEDIRRLTPVGGAK